MLLKAIIMLLERHFVEKPWGRTDLPAAFGAPAAARIGEIWYAGKNGVAMPILVKWLFTSAALSIQVHPSDADAKARGLPSGKEECWYIVDAEPGAVLGIGTTRTLAPDELRAAALSGEITELIDWKPAKAGDFYYIASGTIHAIGAGITLVEVQQPSDITYRLFDYGRARDLHVDSAVSVSHAQPYADSRSGRATDNCRLVSGPHFWIDHVRGSGRLATLPEQSSYWLVPLEGEIRCGGLSARKGDCLRVDGLSGVDVDTDTSLLIAGIAAG